MKSFRNNTKNDTILVSDRAIQTSAATRIGEREIYVSSCDSSSLEIGWYKNNYDTEAGGYYLWRAESPNGTYKKIATIKNVTGKNAATTYLDKNLKLGKTYYYKINAFDPKIKAFDGPQGGYLWWEYKTYKKYNGKIYYGSDGMSEKLVEPYKK